MYLVSSGFSFKPTSSSSSSSSTQFSQEWARRKVVVKHSIKSNQIYHMANVPPEGIQDEKPSPGKNPMTELPRGGGGTIPYGKASPSMVNLPPPPQTHKFYDGGTNTMADCPPGNHTIYGKRSPWRNTIWQYFPKSPPAQIPYVILGVNFFDGGGGGNKSHRWWTFTRQLYIVFALFRANEYHSSWLMLLAKTTFIVTATNGCRSPINCASNYFI